MTNAEEPSDSGREPGFHWMTPVLCVDDLPASLAYYADRLGFAIAWAWSDDAAFEQPDHPTFACVRRGDSCLFLCEKGQGNPGSWICLNVRTRAELTALHEEYVASGARVLAPPTEEPWGMVEMLVEDLDGNTFRMGVPAGEG